MDILMLAPIPPPSGGIASWTMRFIEYCDLEHVSLRIVNIALQGERATKEIMKRSIQVEFKRNIKILINLRQEIRKKRPDIVHINTSCSPFGVLRDALCVFITYGKAPIVLHCRCNIEDQIGLSRLPRLVFRYLVKKSEKVIVLNKFSMKYVNNIDLKKAVFIPDFVNDKMIENSHQINDKINNIVYVGHIERAKGIYQIVDVAKKMPSINFILVGAIREDLSKIEFTSNITFAGRVNSDDVKKYLQEADVFLFPSMSEGFSNALLEAMAMGLPVIASDVGANREMIEDKGGVILEKNDSVHIINAIKFLCDTKIRKAMSEWNTKKVRGEYMMDIVMGKYFDLYNSI